MHFYSLNHHINCKIQTQKKSYKKAARNVIEEDRIHKIHKTMRYGTIDVRKQCHLLFMVSLLVFAYFLQFFSKCKYRVNFY